MNNKAKNSKTDNLKNNQWKAPFKCFALFTIVMLILFIQFCYLSLSKNIYGVNIKEFASNRNTVSDIILAKRGTIFDKEGNILAQNISSYTLVAYLDSSRTTDETNPKHVVDKEYTATKLASVLGSEHYDYILERLNKNSKQVEFGNVGKNITELTKLAIEELELPGISFTETVKRYYPNGNFASYIVGYAKQYNRINIKIGNEYNLYNYYKNFFDNYENVKVVTYDDEIVAVNKTKLVALKNGTCIVLIKSNGDILANIVVNVTSHDPFKSIDTTIVGELGIESHYEDELQGEDGYVIYQQDKYGYKIPDTPEEKVLEKEGHDIYLTIDSNIQRFAESTVNSINTGYHPKWAIVAVMDAKTGEILASATTPSYNPNSLPKDMTYQNPLVSYTYEPGSIMKIYTYMCAIETGKYDGSKTYLSGEYEFEDGTIVHDWNNRGWGRLSYDVGFSYSSNVAIINIIKDYLSLGELKTCLEKYGFNKKTGVELSNEETGNLNFRYETELMAAGYGQGISTTPIQQLQALTIISNNGVMVKPHIVEKIVDNNTNKEYVTPISKSEKLVSDKTIEKIKSLMKSVIDPSSPTGKRFYLEGYDVIGKTGTAQIYEKGKYLTGDDDYIVSIGLMYPKNDPDIIIYAAAKQPEGGSTYALPNTIPELIKNISKYRKMTNGNVENQNDLSYIVDNFINKDLSYAKSILNGKNLEVVVLGSGNKVVNQFPLKGTKVISKDKVFLITNSKDYILPNFEGWSRIDILKYSYYAGIDVTFEGTGYAVRQNIDAGTKINSNLKLKITLENIDIK